jgi:hypothetical protein
MKDLHRWRAPPQPELRGDPAGHPEISVDEVVLSAISSGEVVDRVPERRHVGPERVFRQRSTGIDRHLDDADAICPGNNPRLLQFAAHGENVGFIPMSDEAAAHRIDINILPAGVDSAQQGDRAGVLADHGHAAGHRRSSAGASAAPVVSSRAA